MIRVAFIVVFGLMNVMDCKTQPPAWGLNKDECTCDMVKSMIKDLSDVKVLLMDIKEQGTLASTLQFNQSQPGDKQCNSLSDPENGLVSATSNTSGSTATFICKSGYTLVGSNSTTCQSSGSWSSSSPVCRRSCGSYPADIVFLVDSSGSVKKGNFKKQMEFVATFAKSFVIGPDNVQIGVTTFSNRPKNRFNLATYLSKDLLVSKIENIPYSKGGTYTDLALKYIKDNSFTENAGDRPQVANILIVMTDGRSRNSSLTVIEAEKLHQMDIKVFAIGIGSKVDMVEIGRIATDATHVFQVQDFDVLSFIQETIKKSICERYCPVLMSPDNGSVNTTGVQYDGQTARYTCNNGYTLDGSPSRMCQSNGTWSDTQPACLKECSQLSDPVNGKVSTTGITQSSQASFTCNNDYTLDGTSPITCQSTGQWSAPAPTCRKNCPVLMSPDNGSVNTTGVQYDGQTAGYTCKNGYTLDGSSLIMCQSNGTWSGTKPTCLKDCPVLMSPDNGSVNTTGVQYDGQTARYTCNNGYTLDGSSLIMCQSNGTWSDTQPACLKECSQLSDPVNGKVSTTGITQGSQASFTCNNDYTLDGTSPITCQSTGQWSAPAPTCRKKCSQLSDPVNGKVSTTGITQGSQASFTCNNDYTLDGTSPITCQFTGQWSAPAPTCRKNCPVLMSPDNGSVNTTGVQYDGQTAGYTCKNGYTLDGSSLIMCQSNGTWSGTKPTCLKECSQLSDPVNGKVSTTGITQGSQASFTCNTGYDLEGTSPITCRSTGQWSAPVPICSERCKENIVAGLSDDKITASSYYDDWHKPLQGRHDNSNIWDHWLPKNLFSADEYLQFEFPEVKFVTALTTYFYEFDFENTRAYNVTTSIDCSTFTSTLPIFRTGDISIVINRFPEPVLARCVRIQAVEWRRYITMDLILLGCDADKQK